MEKIKGTNLGNWLVLEEWMQPEFFEGTGAADEIWLGRKLPALELEEKMKKHRDTYVTEEDFAFIAKQGINLVRIPVPYFVFGDRPPYPGCIEYLDLAFKWAGKYGLQVLIDLHTVPGGQNGYDNGGITGVCKWCKNPTEVEFALTVLERLAEHYKGRKELYGIEVLNEPISWSVYVTAPSTGKAVDKEEAKGSGYVPLKFLKDFYIEAYKRLRAILKEETVIMFHDGFRLSAWKDFFVRNHMKNVVLDTHIYIFAMENFVPFAKPWVYQIYINSQKRKIAKAQKYTPVVVGEWCICNKYAEKATGATRSKALAEKARRYNEIANLEMDAWAECSGWIYWNYQMRRDMNTPMDVSWKESWDLRRCIKNGWMKG
jgi:glucan 1,3-beta-glucosidase